ncbi:MAG: ribosome-associated translation inhibitor RaiA [Planctomycetes bacterium]|nr:ribosome-associated translation inhibitor RaiA [Planctomycetota bacterium]
MTSNREVPIDITSKQGQLSDRMSEYATKKCQRLVRFNDRTTRIEVVVHGPHEAPEVEILVHVEHAGPFVAREQGEHFSNVVDSLVSKLERQLKKAKEKHEQKIHRHDSIRDVPDPDSIEPDSEESFEDAIRKNLDS